MVYVPYPSLSPPTRLDGATAIDWAKVDAPVPVAAGGQRLTLEMRDAEPVWPIVGVPAGAVEKVIRDQRTVAGGFDRHRAFCKVSFATGLSVQRTTRSQRFWDWPGVVPHWLYPTVLRQDGAAWRRS